LAVNGSMIKYSQTLRMYSLLLFLSLLSIWLFARYFNRGKNWIWLIVANVLLINTHYFGWLVVGSEVLAILLFQRIKLGRVALMAAIAGLSFAPWVFAIINAGRTSSDLAQNIAWQTRPGLSEVTAFLLALGEPFYAQSSNAEPLSIYYVSIPILLLGIISLAMFLAEKKGDDELAAVKLLSLFAIFPPTVAFVLSWALPHSIWGTRHLVVITPVALLLTAIAIVKIPERKTSLGIAALIVILTSVGLYREIRRPPPNYVWCAWDGIAKEIVETEASNGTELTIYTFEQLSAYHLWFALRNHDTPSVRVFKGIDVRTADASYFLPRGFDDVKTVRIEEIDEAEFWLVFRTFRIGEEFSMIENFTRIGYSICSPKQTRFDSNNVFRMKIVKGSGTCPPFN
jgi:hypothetical protein